MADYPLKWIFVLTTWISVILRIGIDSRRVTCGNDNNLHMGYTYHPVMFSRHCRDTYYYYECGRDGLDGGRPGGPVMCRAMETDMDCVRDRRKCNGTSIKRSLTDTISVTVSCDRNQVVELNSIRYVWLYGSDKYCNVDQELRDSICPNIIPPPGMYGTEKSCLANLDPEAISQWKNKCGSKRVCNMKIPRRDRISCEDIMTVGKCHIVISYLRCYPELVSVQFSCVNKASETTVVEKSEKTTSAYIQPPVSGMLLSRGQVMLVVGGGCVLFLFIVTVAPTLIRRRAHLQSLAESEDTERSQKTDKAHRGSHAQEGIYEYMDRSAINLNQYEN